MTHVLHGPINSRVLPGAKCDLSKCKDVTNCFCSLFVAPLHLFRSLLASVSTRLFIGPLVVMLALRTSTLLYFIVLNINTKLFMLSDE